MRKATRPGDRQAALDAVVAAIQASWRAGPLLIGSKEVALMARVLARAVVSDEDIELLEETADSYVRSYQYPAGTPDRKQPTEWHEGRKLQALAARLKALREIEKKDVP